ncbi:hypothetical protein [Nocardia paucivorans]|uniref:hypothetical protein n=1 Tax=Nocardia paucivorans TaxID=114259 RepID=UPI0002F02ABF|nr:hypothetical protein [Nocardia paucivorans]
MTPVAPADQINRWRMEKCEDRIPPSSIEHARFELTFHAGHGCQRFLDGLAYSTAVM